ncbi:MAG: hypothetical protein V5A48_13815, partial [Salinivenus sp.]
VELRTENGSVLVAAAEPAALDTTGGPSAEEAPAADREEPAALDVPPSDTTVGPQPPADTAQADTVDADTTEADTTQS